MGNKLKIIEKWRNHRYFNSMSYICETPKGLKIAITVNPQSREFNFAVIANVGARYEPQIGVPRGTAHFLEHLMAGSPNKIFKTRQEFDDFSYGTKYKPSFYYNAKTNYSAVTFLASGHRDATKRMLRFIKAQLDIPDKNILENIEKERKIIIAEIARQNKEEADSSYKYDEFFLKETHPELIDYISGTEVSVNSVNAEHLFKFKDELMKRERAILGIQMSEFPEGDILEQIIKFENCFTSEKSNIVENESKIKDTSKFTHHEDKHKKEIFFSINYISQDVERGDYRNWVLNGAMLSLMNKVFFEYLREEKNLIYSAGMFSSYLAGTNMTRGVSISCTLNSLKEVLDESYNAMHVYYKEFMESGKGKKWFDDRLSHFIYDLNRNYSAGFGENIACNYRYKDPFYNWDFRKTKKESLQMTISSLLDHVEKTFHTLKPAFWFVSPYEESEVLGVLKSSKFYEVYANGASK